MLLDQISRTHILHFSHERCIQTKAMKMCIRLVHHCPQFSSRPFGDSLSVCALLRPSLPKNRPSLPCSPLLFQARGPIFDTCLEVNCNIASRASHTPTLTGPCAAISPLYITPIRHPAWRRATGSNIVTMSYCPSFWIGYFSASMTFKMRIELPKLYQQLSGKLGEGCDVLRICWCNCSTLSLAMLLVQEW